mmetsp:Transcript_5853/g.8776  ORF Transcript_5853/g.8776 Transcript_5853/m.8776 type:complete len:317 (-) Transcript_5853:78-1028(-)
MAGDDLESDDEYLDQSWAGKNETVSVALDESTIQQNNNDGGVNTALGLGKKRLRGSSEFQGQGDSDNNNDDDDDDDAISSSKKKKKSMSSKHLLLEAGRGIAEETAEVQAQFLWTCFTNVLKLRGEDIPDQKFHSGMFKKSTKSEHGNENGGGKYDPSMSKFLKSGVLSSAKRLKKWKHNKSPMVIIICASARRAVSILKEISSLNVRAAKLFAKHMSVADQTAMLENNKYSIAVGTPNRLLKLTEEKRESDDADEELGAPLSLDQTELIIIDCHEDKKRFTVCTLNDTAPDLMVFINKAVLPQLERRKTLNLALF